MSLTPLEPWIATKIGSKSAPLERLDLERCQLAQLNQTIQAARTRSRFYSKHLAHAPDSIDRLEGLSGFPFTTAEDLRRESLAFLCVSQSEIQRVVTLDTSGTTGSPKRLYFTQADQELTIDFFRCGMATFTRPGDRVLILLPHERPGSVGDLLARGLERLEAVPVSHGPVRSPADAMSVLEAGPVDVLVGTPANVLTLARFWNAEAHPRTKKPAQVLLSTDHVPQAIVAALEETWGCTVYNHYGMTEMGLGGGVECQERRGLHLREADLYFEIIDPTSGEPLQEGETGEIVFTTLTRQGMPLIRYRTGDLSRFIPGACGCGTALRSLEKVTRRLSGGVALPGAEALPKLYLADLDEALFAIPRVVNFSACLDDRAGQDGVLLTIQLQVLPAAADNLEGQLAPALDTIPAIRGARDAAMLTLRIEFEPMLASDPAPSLAKRTILDRRGNNRR